MALPTPEQVAEEYLTNLGILKPQADIQSQDTDWWIRAHVIGGVISGAYGDLNLLENDIFPQSSRHDALGKHLFTYFPSPDNTFKPATSAAGPVDVSGVSGTIIPTSTIFQYSPNGNTYQPTVQVTLMGPTGTIDVTSVATGQAQNLPAGSPLIVTNPPAGLNGTASVGTMPLAGGTDPESDISAANRILSRLQSPPAGGTEADYKNYALSVPGVVDVNVIRFIYGLGTVGVVITSGTTDIDSAINNNQPIIRTPSQDLVNLVQTTLETKVPETDCVYVLPPQEVLISVTGQITFSQGDGNTVPTGQTLTQNQLVTREIQRAVYKTPPGGRKLGGSGFVVNSDIEESLGVNLGNTVYAQGFYAQILADWQIKDLSTTGANRGILPFQIAVPGAIVLESF